MIPYVFSYAQQFTNYNIMNETNVFNFMIATLETLTDEQKEKFVQNIKIHIGMSFFNDFKLYLFKKMPDSQLLNKYFK